MTPVVTISIPAYKQPEVLLRTVNSVLVQKNCEFEIVITDDSDDDSVEVALGYSNQRFFKPETATTITLCSRKFKRRIYQQAVQCFTIRN